MMKNAIVLLFVLVSLALLGTTVYFYSRYRSLAKTTKPAEDVGYWVEKVGKHVLLPQGETPTVMTVVDKEKRAGQLFFANAKNGDKILVYMEAKKAFLYNPETDRVIEIGPVTVGGSEASGSATSASLQQPPTPTPTPSVIVTPAAYRFIVLNGTRVAGLTRTYESTLKSAFPAATIVARGDTKGNDYEASLVVALTTGAKADAARVAEALHMTAGSLPAAEATPSAQGDFLIILGQDIP